MTVENIMTELEAKADSGIKKILLKHGIKEPFFGVKVEDLKRIQKKIKKDYTLSKGLYDTGNADAMYLAGLIADEDKMTKADLCDWLKKALSQNIIEYTVPWIAAESRFGFESALEWIDDKKEHVATAGWCALRSLVSIKDDADLDVPALKKLLDRVEKTIHLSDDRVKNSMNSFVIAAGSYVAPLTEYSLVVARRIGDVKIESGDTACKVPDAATYILKVKNKGALGKKKKMARC